MTIPPPSGTGHASVVTATWRATGAEGTGDAATGAIGVRFPLFPPLLAAIESQLSNGLPAQWWVHPVCSSGAVGKDDGQAADQAADMAAHRGSSGAACCDGALESNVRSRIAHEGVHVDVCAVARAEVQLRARLQAHLLLNVRRSEPASWHVFLWLLEDWCLARSLLRSAGALKGSDVAAHRHRLELRAPPAVWQSELLSFVRLSDDADAARELQGGGAHRQVVVDLCIVSDINSGCGDGASRIDIDMCSVCAQ